MNGHFPKFRLDAVDTHSHVRDRNTEDFRYLFIALIVEPQQNQRAFQFAEVAYEPIEFLQCPFPDSRGDRFCLNLQIKEKKNRTY